MYVYDFGGRRARYPTAAGQISRLVRSCTQFLSCLKFHESSPIHVSYERCSVAAEERPPDLFQQPINEVALLDAVMVHRADAVQG